jgi:hypothetical protein
MADLPDLEMFISQNKNASAQKKDLVFLGEQSKKADILMLSSKSVSQKENFVTRMAVKGKPQNDVSAREEGRVLSYASSRKTEKDLSKHNWANRELLKNSKAPLAADAVQFHKYMKETDKLADVTSRRKGEPR